MTWADLPALYPMLIPAATAVLLLLTLTVRRDARLAAGVAMAGFIAFDCASSGMSGAFIQSAISACCSLIFSKS